MIPAQMPNTVIGTAARPPTSALRATRAMSGPGVITRIAATPQNASSSGGQNQDTCIDCRDGPVGLKGRPGDVPVARHALRALLQIADDADALRPFTDALARGQAVAHASSALRPYLLASLLESPEATPSRPALIVTADDRSARGPRRRPAGVPRAPPRPPLPLPRHRLPLPRRPAAPPGGAPGRRPQSAGERGRPTVVVASAIALAEAVPDPSCGRRASRCTRASRSTSATSPSCSRTPATSGSSRSRSAASSRSAAASSTSIRRPRSGRSGWSCSATRSSRMRWFSIFTQRSLGDAERVELAPAAELGPSTGSSRTSRRIPPRPRPRSAPTSRR